jgi:glucose-6-phosphate dehydrogenase assembly protein OpcA
VAQALSAAPVQAEEWVGEDVAVSDVERALWELRDASAQGTEGPDLRTSVMTHLAWVPTEWREAAVETLAGLGERHPSRGILLFPAPSAPDGIDAKVSVLAFPQRGGRRHIAAEVIQLTLRGRRATAPASIVTPLLVTDLPVFLRWRGELPFGSHELEQMVGVCDRLVVDSREWKDVAGAYRTLESLFEQTAVSDIAWRCTWPWRRALAGLWPGIAEASELRVTASMAEALLLVGWLRSRLDRPIELVHEASAGIESVAVDGTAVSFPGDETESSSDLLSAELDELSRDEIYEGAVRAASAR